MDLLCRIVTPHPDIVVVQKTNKTIHKNNDNMRNEQKTCNMLSLHLLLSPVILDCQEVYAASDTLRKHAISPIQMKEPCALQYLLLPLAL